MGGLPRDIGSNQRSSGQTGFQFLRQTNGKADARYVMAKSLLFSLITSAH